MQYNMVVRIDSNNQIKNDRMKFDNRNFHLTKPNTMCKTNDFRCIFQEENIATRKRHAKINWTIV